MTFWARFLNETLQKQAVIAGTIVRLLFMKTVIDLDAASLAYTDQALKPVEDGEDHRLELFTKTTGGHAAAAHSRRIAQLTGHGSVG